MGRGDGESVYRPPPPPPPQWEFNLELRNSTNVTAVAFCKNYRRKGTEDAKKVSASFPG